MSRYIEQEYIGRTINHLPTQYISRECENNRTEVEIMVSIIAVNKVIKDAPSIDIVRCKECKWLRYCETEDLDLYLDCDKPDGGGIPQNEDWFCADGEREGE